MRLRWIILLLAVVVAGCATPAAVVQQTSYVSELPLGHQTSRTYERNYSLGIERTANVGDQVIRIREVLVNYEVTALYSPAANFSLTDGQLVLPFDMAETLRGSRVMAMKVGTPSVIARNNRGFGILVRPDGTIEDSVVSYEQRGAVVLPNRFTSSIPSPVLIRRESREEVGRRPGEANFDIIFTGNDGSAMRFTYREYTADDLARSSFFQELSYPLHSRQIRFRDILISVANVDAESITYTVEQDGLVEIPVLSSSE